MYVELVCCDGPLLSDWLLSTEFRERVADHEMDNFNKYKRMTGALKHQQSNEYDDNVVGVKRLKVGEDPLN